VFGASAVPVSPDDLAIVVDACGYGVRPKRGERIVDRGIGSHFTILRVRCLLGGVVEC
jgi:hypothetical protein